MPRSLQFLNDQDLLVVSYLNHGVVLVVSVQSVTSKPLMTVPLQVLGHALKKFHLADSPKVLSNVSHRYCIRLVIWCSDANSGRSCLSLDQTTIAITNLFDGVDLYSVADRRLVSSIKSPIAENVPVQVTFDRCGDVAIGGSSGVIHVFQTSPPATVQKLELKSTLSHPSVAIPH